MSDRMKGLVTGGWAIMRIVTEKSQVLKWISGLMVIMAFFSLSYIDTYAGMTPRRIELNMKKETKIKEDLDGDGVQDKIIVELEKNNIGLYYLSLYINEVKFGPWTQQFDGTATMLITDIDDSDGKKEIWIGHDWGGKWHINSIFTVGKYYSFSSLYHIEAPENPCIIPPVSSDAEILSEGDGYITYESEYSVKGLGNYLYYAKLRLKAGSLTYVGDLKCHKTTVEWQKDRPYKLTKGIEVYSKFRAKKPIFSLKKKERFYIYELRFTKTKKDEYGYLHLSNPWAFIKTKDGKSGWIKIPKGDFYKAKNNSKY